MKKNEIILLPELVQRYIKYQSAVKNKSALTINEYALDLRTFFRFCVYEKDLCATDADFQYIDISLLDVDFFKEINLENVYSFMQYCRNERNNSPRTITRKVSSIRSFYRYLTLSLKLLDEDPMQGLETPKLTKSLPKYLTLEQSLDLLSCVDGKNRERDYCIITFFLNCGLRLAELVSLDYTDIRPDGTVRVIGKGRKERIIYLNEACIKAYETYMKVRPKTNLKDNDKNALFISNRLQRISPKTVQHLVYSFIEKSGLGNQGFSVHKLRHTAATLMYQHGGADVLVLKEILGHENLGTTQIYTHVNNEKMKKASDSNPLAKLEGRFIAVDTNKKTKE